MLVLQPSGPSELRVFSPVERFNLTFSFHPASLPPFTQAQAGTSGSYPVGSPSLLRTLGWGEGKESDLAYSWLLLPPFLTGCLCPLCGRPETVGHLVGHSEEVFGGVVELPMPLFPGVGDRTFYHLA